MPKFFYIIRNRAGKKDSGVEEAATQEEAVSRLQARDLILINIIPEQKETPASAASSKAILKKKPKIRHHRITSDDLVVFCRQLATLLGAGVTILKSLDIIYQQVSSRKFCVVIDDLRRNMEAGLTFHAAMAKHPQIFSELWVNLVDSGEASGNLAMVLGRLASYLERSAAFKKKVISALMYPGILMAAGTGALLFLTFKIIPTFANLFKNFNIALPLLTQVLVFISSFLRQNIIFILVGGFFLVWGLRSYIKTKPGRRNFERLQFRLPVLGEFFRALVVERFSSSMSTLIESGVPILYSLEITEHSVGNSIMAEVVNRVKDQVRDGKPLSQPLEASGFFEPMVVQMVRVGEEIGELPDMFKKINFFYQEYVETFLTRFTALFEPIMLLFMGGIIGIMIRGMFVPIFQIAQIGGS